MQYHSTYERKKNSSRAVRWDNIILNDKLLLRLPQQLKQEMQKHSLMFHGKQSLNVGLRLTVFISN